MDLMTYALCKGNGGGGSAKIITLNATTMGESIIIESDLPSWDEITSTFNSCGYIALVFPIVGTLVLKSDYAASGGNYHFSSTMITDTNVTYKCSLEFYREDDDAIAYTGKFYEASPFIVTCTPTNPDFSGVMDKNISEIKQAWDDGKRIVFKLVTPTNQMFVDCIEVGFDSSEYPSFNASIIDNGDITGSWAILKIFTGTSSTDNNTYNVAIKQL